jgi:DNA polymerase III epsilon subunit-like protein
MKRTYVSLDLETTGLNPETDEIIEIGAVKFEGDEIIDTFSSLVNPSSRPSWKRPLNSLNCLTVCYPSSKAVLWWDITFHLTLDF